MRRILQSKGVEVIHLGHNRSVHEIAEAAIEEDVQAIAITSYQGGHLEFFKYLRDLLDESGCGHIRIFGGGGGTILPTEIQWLQENGISRIYSPDDGRAMGLEGMIDDLIRETEKTLIPNGGFSGLQKKTGMGNFPLGNTRKSGKLPAPSPMLKTVRKQPDQPSTNANHQLANSGHRNHGYRWSREKQCDR